jgi:hypothetical protein
VEKIILKPMENCHEIAAVLILPRSFEIRALPFSTKPYLQNWILSNKRTFFHQNLYDDFIKRIKDN